VKSQWLSIVGVALIVPALAAPQTASQSHSNVLLVRSIRIIPVPTSREGLPDPGTKIQKALASVPLIVESKVTGQGLIDAIEKAEKSIQSVYERMGRSVRVEHETEQLAGRSIELRFRIIELCSGERSK
jgi:hypothetical protein